jgi:hypothetical protein
MASSGMLRRVALLRTDVSEELGASIIRVIRIGELGTLAVTNNRRTLRRKQSSLPHLVTDCRLTLTTEATARSCSLILVP